MIPVEMSMNFFGYFLSSKEMSQTMKMLSLIIFVTKIDQLGGCSVDNFSF